MGDSWIGVSAVAAAGSATHTTATSTPLLQRAKARGVGDDDLAAFGRDVRLLLELRQSQRHRLPRGADQVRQLLMRNFQRDEGSARVVDSVLVGQLEQQLRQL